MTICSSDPIIIVGAGACGLSAALHLSQRGYTNVSVFEKNDRIPSGDLTNVYRAAQDAGVQFFLGQQVDEIVYVSTLTGRKNAGIRTRDAQFYPSSLVIIETSAGAGGNYPSGTGQLQAPDALATPLSWYSGINHSNSPVDYVPNESSSVILLCGDPRPSSSTFPMVGSLVLDLLGATSNQQTTVDAQNLSDILPAKRAKL